MKNIVKGAHRAEKAEKTFFDKGANQEDAGDGHAEGGKDYLGLGAKVNGQLTKITGKYG